MKLRPEHPLPEERFRDPSRYVLGIGLPLSKDEFCAPVGGRQRTFLLGEPELERKLDCLVADAKRISALAQPMGIRLARVRTLQDLRGLFRADSDGPQPNAAPEVVTLFAHTDVPEGTADLESSGRQPRIELVYETLTWTEMWAAIPVEFKGLLDLRTCHSESDADSLRPRDIVVFSVNGVEDVPFEFWKYELALTQVSQGIPFHEAIFVANQKSEEQKQRLEQKNMTRVEREIQTAFDNYQRCRAGRMGGGPPEAAPPNDDGSADVRRLINTLEELARQETRSFWLSMGLAVLVVSIGLPILQWAGFGVLVNIIGTGATLAGFLQLVIRRGIELKKATRARGLVKNARTVQEVDALTEKGKQQGKRSDETRPQEAPVHLHTDKPARTEEEQDSTGTESRTK